jgi:riboflavin synthase alpha subunit
MFTGIIKAKGTIAAMQEQAGDMRLTVKSPGLPWAD